jgi:hypothetical protein
MTQASRRLPDAAVVHGAPRRNVARYAEHTMEYRGTIG